MKHNLNTQDIDDLKYQCRMIYIVTSLFGIIGITISLMIYEFEFNTTTNDFNFQIDLLIISAFILISFLLSQSLNRKYYEDISNNVKIAKTKLIQRKNAMTDYEAGSGQVKYKSGDANKAMNEFARYELIIDNTRYLVTRELFELCKDGDEVIFFYASVSNYLLSIEKK